MRCEQKLFAGHACLEITTGRLSCHVTLDAGPRVLSLQNSSGTELFYKAPSQGKRDADAFASLGGHRLWIAPETELTYFNDDAKLVWEQHNDRITFLPPPEMHPHGVEIQKCLTLEEVAGNVLHLTHSVTNKGSSPLKLAPWAITMMAPGGAAVLPQPEKAPHDMQHLLPQSQLALWSYTDFSDPRWTFLADQLVLRHDAAPRGRFTMQKTGLFHPRGWIAYLLASAAFIKVIPDADRAAEYPDRGCNLEAFSNAEFLEIETLGPLVTLSQGEATRHSEYWSVIDVSGSSEVKAVIAQNIQPELARMRQNVPSLR